VTWTIEGSAAHNISFTTSGSPANIGNFSTGSSSRTFPNSGTYAYQCTNHPGMSGSVTVQ
jgi:plastocyanin